MKVRNMALSHLLIAALLCGSSLHAQDTTIVTESKTDTTTTVGEDLKNAAKKTGKAIKKGAEKVGDKTAELAAKGAAAVVDRVHKTKVGPNGQTIYIKDDTSYYWVDDEGHRHYVDKSELKDKP